MGSAERILDIFRARGIRPGDRLHKRELMDAIKATGMDVTEVRDGWHAALSMGWIRQVGDELELTPSGARTLYGDSST